MISEKAWSRIVVGGEPWDDVFGEATLQLIGTSGDVLGEGEFSGVGSADIATNKEGYVDRFRLTTKDPDVFAAGTVGVCGDIKTLVGPVLSVPGNTICISDLQVVAI